MSHIDRRKEDMDVVERVVGTVRERLERDPDAGETIALDVRPCGDGQFAAVKRRRNAGSPRRPRR